LSDYHINIFWSDEDGGKPIPKPTYRPVDRRSA
jgi:hypothetical protein